MYRDLIGAPEQIEAAGKTWWTQMFCKWSGELEAINLYDEDGDFVAEFSSTEELQDFLSKVRPNGCCWGEADAWACENLKGEELSYFYSTTD